MKNKWLMGIIVAAVVIGSGVVILGRGAGQQTPSLEAAPIAQQTTSAIVAEGRVVPVQSAGLSFAASGIVAEVLVKEGDVVSANQALLRLNGARAQANVAQAQASLSRAQARLTELKAGPRAPEIASVAAALDAASAQLARIQAPARAEDLAAAQAELTAARATLQKVLEGSSQKQLIAAAAELANAEAAVRQAQAAYDRVQGDPNIGARPEALQLQQATNNYNAAAARYEDLKQGASAADIAQARAQMQRAQATLDKVKVPARAEDIAAAQADVRRAQAQLDLIEAGTRPEVVAAAAADVEAAAPGLTKPRPLADTELRAPFAGAVAVLSAKVGENVAPGMVAVQLADLSVWQIETEDLTEIAVVKVSAGDTVKLTFDAIPDLEMTGKVLTIGALGVSKQGDITYKVVVAPEKSDSRLRWNMTASVTLSK
ncbi:MAG: HlyD family efflux transporter periplasmic adaptor subunit [Anaerolineae bacterium]|uniref:HlyD family secretion protein n=1 Tax=Candidatus Amarolinea dominans TaxID=3140696 RepID=UPI0031356BF7|nr:HlyD family efflux transporter periplasmic adaptor subunit [Anaerolineae bacterium]